MGGGWRWGFEARAYISSCHKRILLLTELALHHIGFLYAELGPDQAQMYPLPLIGFFRASSRPFNSNKICLLPHWVLFGAIWWHLLVTVRKLSGFYFLTRLLCNWGTPPAGLDFLGANLIGPIIHLTFRHSCRARPSMAPKWLRGHRLGWKSR